MIRTVLGVLVGVVVGLVVISVVEGMGHTLFPPPPGVNLTDPAQLSTVMAKIPLQAKIVVLLAWALGTLAGASSANLLAGRRAWAGRIVALIVLALAGFNMTTIAHPPWMMAGAVVGVLLAAALADRAFGRPRLRGATAP